MLKKLFISAGAAALAFVPAGCSELTSIAPTQTAAVQTDITDAYVMLCGTGAVGTGAIALLTPSSGILPTYGQQAVVVVQQICANGAPTNEVVAGFDIFIVATAVEDMVGSKSTKAKAHTLAVKHRVA